MGRSFEPSWDFPTGDAGHPEETLIGGCEANLAKKWNGKNNCRPTGKVVDVNQIVSVRVQPDENLRYTVAVYLENTTKSEHLLAEINKYADQVERKDPQRFKETLALFKKHRKAEEKKATE